MGTALKAAMAAIFFFTTPVFGAMVDLKNSRFLYNPTPKLYDASSGIEHIVPIQSAFTSHWISPGVGIDGSHSLGISFHNNPGCAEKQRTELEIRSSKMGEEIYHAFSVFIHPRSKPLRGETIFSQIWQNHDVTSAKRPPLALSFTGPDYGVAVSTSKDGSDPKGDTRVIGTAGPLTKGEWHRFIVRFKPSVSASGAVTVWLDGVRLVSQTHQRNFGYAVKSVKPVVLDLLTTRIGLYRGRQRCPVTAADNYNEMHVFFDNIKYGKTFEEVAQ